jgi:hypothetical protein
VKTQSQIRGWGNVGGVTLMASRADLNKRQQESPQENYNQVNERYGRGKVHCFVSDFYKDLRITSAVESLLTPRCD